MATVILPLGYPVESGAVGDSMIYQGTVVKVYTLPKDPRTDAQIFQRKLFSDIAKMRASAGEWAKRSWRISYGSKWTSVIMQMAKADVDGYWSDAWDEWDGFSIAQQDYIRENCGFLGTFNDPGRVWWALYSMLYKWDLNNGGVLFYQPVPNANDPDAMFTWWLIGADGYGLKSNADVATWYDDRISWASQNGTWAFWSGSGPRDDTLKQGSTVGGYLEVFYSFNHCRLWYAKNVDTGIIQVYYDGAVQSSIDTNGALTWQQILDVGLILPAQQPLRFIHGGPSGKLIDIDGAELWTIYKGEYLELLGAGWNKVNAVGAAEGYYHLRTGVGQTSFAFNFTGRYCKIYFPKRPDFSTWSFYVDGIAQSGYMPYAAVEVQRDFHILGPFRKTLHRCQVVASSNIAVDEVVIRDKKSEL